MTLAVDLCAGSGWAVACQRLGISELGIEIMPEAIATRDAMGVYTQDISIADLPDSFCSQAPIQIAGPPCQTFSMAGSGEGRRALNEVLSRVAWFAATGSLSRGGSGDPRTWLVLEPLRLAVGGLPLFIVWEQVPPVLPVWEACADVLRTLGYSVWTGDSAIRDLTVISKAPHWAEHGPSPAQSIRVSVAEAAVLQTFPVDHPFQGTSGKKYLQIGNAVPPLLGVAILRTFLKETTP